MAAAGGLAGQRLQRLAGVARIPAQNRTYLTLHGNTIARGEVRENEGARMLNCSERPGKEAPTYKLTRRCTNAMQP